MSILNHIQCLCLAIIAIQVIFVVMVESRNGEMHFGSKTGSHGSRGRGMHFGSKSNHGSARSRGRHVHIGPESAGGRGGGMHFGHKQNHGGRGNGMHFGSKTSSFHSEPRHHQENYVVPLDIDVGRLDQSPFPKHEDGNNFCAEVKR